MATISAKVRLRPTRIGFAVKPTDMKSLRQIMRVNTCVWGGIYNPIIPVGRSLPAEWKDPFGRSSLEISQGYARFFEPDVWVEATPGLVEDLGITPVNPHSAHGQVVALDQFLASDSGGEEVYPALGLSMADVTRHQYEKEQQFVLRHPRPAVIVPARRQDGLVEAMFGVFPRERGAAYFERNFREVFTPEEADCSPATWKRAFVEGARDPLFETAQFLERRRYWHHEKLIFVFDPARPTDLIDLWNLRLQPSPVLPIPLAWLPELAESICEIVREAYQPIRGNPQGLMHHSTMEFSRSLSEQEVMEALSPITPQIPTGALHVKTWRSRIWEPQTSRFVSPLERMQVTAEERSSSPKPDGEGDDRLTLEGLTPPFARQFSRAKARWANVVTLRTYGDSDIAMAIPFNLFDTAWPRLGMFGGEPITVTTEGWVVPQVHTNWDVTLRLPKMAELIKEFLGRRGIKASLSEPGRLAAQIHERLGEWGLSLIGTPETLALLNKMAGSTRSRSNQTGTVEETFAGRTAGLDTWKRHLARRNKSALSSITLSRFTEAEILRLGLEARCKHCDFKNWYGLDALDYEVACERCLKTFRFPQGDVPPGQQAFRYRVIGPFSVPDYARGAYGALLALRALRRVGASMLDSSTTFSTALDLQIEGSLMEVDYFAFRQDRERARPSETEMVIGEAKSFGSGELIELKDLQKLKHVAIRLPGAAIAISVLRDHLTPKEIKLLRKSVSWARGPRAQYGVHRHPVILLTGKELFTDHQIFEAWKAEGHSIGDEHDHTFDFTSLAVATQRLYLGLEEPRPAFLKVAAVVPEATTSQAEGDNP